MKNKSLTPFDYIKSVFEKREFDGDGHEFHYIALRYFSIYPNSTLEAILSAKYYGKIGHKEFGQLLFHLIPQEKPSPFIRYIKKSKQAKHDKSFVAEVCRAYHVGERHALEIIEIAKAAKINLKRELGIQK